LANPLLDFGQMPGLAIFFEPVSVWERAEQARFMLIQKVKRESFKSSSPLSVEFKDFCSCFVDLCDSSIFNQVWAIF